MGLSLGKERGGGSRGVEEGVGGEKGERAGREGGERVRERTRTRKLQLILNDSSVRSIWTYLTASPCRLYHKDK